MSKLYLQRHLKSQWNVDDRFAGWANAPLAKEGLDIVKVVADRLVGEKFDIGFKNKNDSNISNLYDKYNWFDPYEFILDSFLVSNKLLISSEILLIFN